MKGMIKIKCGIIFLALIFSFSISSCSWAQKIMMSHPVEMPNIQIDKSLLSMTLFVKVNEIEKHILKINVVLFSMADSVNVNRIEIESPSFVKPGLRGELEPFCLVTGQTKTQTYNFTIEKNESFKLKGIVYGDIDNGKIKINAIKNLFFYWDENHYIISGCISEIIGQRKNNGEILTIEDLRIFNREEIE